MDKYRNIPPHLLLPPETIFHGRARTRVFEPGLRVGSHLLLPPRTAGQLVPRVKRFGKPSILVIHLTIEENIVQVSGRSICFVVFFAVNIPASPEFPSDLFSIVVVIPLSTPMETGTASAVAIRIDTAGLIFASP
ncbi:hypothetical protein ACFSKL_06910 [Belliella marina]|uniref:Uncharacterized protein n=1 Tax=Belliella marina TaxID=1644146 RepID=A0ABW4VLD0_9BACT